MKTIYSLNCKSEVELREVGGKALSLIKSIQAGLPVPSGLVLAVDFFRPWITKIKESGEWKTLIDSFPQGVAEKAGKVKNLALSFGWESGQLEALKKALAEQAQPSALFAVRSSSPEEDLEGASFAGGYVTLLGVRDAELLPAVRQCFASCLDQRVLLYKDQHKFDLSEPKIAVIIQNQIAADTSGVAFSLNPLNNSYDETVINANYGLGETVVAGQVTPDTFIVDKLTNTILESKTGQKQTSLWLEAEGGVREEPAVNRDALCLSESQVLEIADLTKKVEEFYQKPMDIEWAFSHGRLFLLQARPITAYIPLLPEMITAPGEPKLLYLDMTLIKQGIQVPMSVLGIDYMRLIQKYLFADFMGTEDIIHIKEGMADSLGGRSYINYSNSMKLQGKKRVIATAGTQDLLLTKILKANDLSEYIPKKLPRRFKGVLWKTIKNNITSIKNAFKAYRKPKEYKLFLKKETEKFSTALKEVLNKELGIKETAEKTTILFVRFLDDITLAATYAAELARFTMKRIFKKEPGEIKDKLVYLERALPENITVEMGLAMYQLSLFPEVSRCASRNDFVEGLEQKRFSPEFLKAYNGYMETYGHRCPLELDAGIPRTYENPGDFFDNLKNMSGLAGSANNPQTIFEQSQKEREQAYNEFQEIAGKRRKGKKLAKTYAALVEFGGYREFHKYWYIKIVDAFRRRVLQAAHLFVSQGRLNSLDQVNRLTIENLEAALKDNSLDLKALAEKNYAFHRRLEQVKSFPRLIDSRGKILRLPPQKPQAGELAGEPIAPGVVRGKVKVLHTPNEKPLNPGEIMVARATDPGWTPLFINAGGIVLEIGGLLQHGALVAREYGKTCVAGIENATEVLKDGQEVEVDGTTGLVKLLETVN